ncbi:unnamed protein product [Lactuca saligna]|uniref:Leucine-rich repeat-containing N-terminal plant-type domain-containing protein n=1 Tax=Lactuca saligna TaxID=75948 RepID=A0AA36EBI9_LACSI|nr:unnamed protein product [Lactuca saligna]
MITNIFIFVMHVYGLIFFSLLLLCLETATSNHLGAVGGYDKERDALLQFKANLQDPYGILSTWTADGDECCKWDGVTCNRKTGHITMLDINSGALGGQISHALHNLSYLTHLDLSINSLYGAIPTFIGSLTRLRYLNLGSNHFNGTIPRSIGSLTKLKYLDLSDNSLYGTIPSEFGNLTNLQRLELGDVGRCTVENLEWLSHLSRLEVFEIYGVSLAKQNYWVDVILSLRKLSDLGLGGCELSEVMHPYSSSLNSSSSIVSLSLEQNNLNSSMYRWLFPLTTNKLRDLSLSSNTLDLVPKYLGNLCNLTSFYMLENSAVVNFPDILNNLSGCASHRLQDLFVRGSQFIGSVSDEIQKFSSLEQLDLSDNHLNGTISDKLWELPRLTNLNISFNYFRGVISGNIGRSKTLVIDLSKNPLQGVPPTYHMSNLSYVRIIDLSSCKLGPGFPKWIQTLKNLSYLDISNNGISDTTPLEFWDAWPSRLKYLNLSSNNITGKIPDLSSNFISRSVIDLSSNNLCGLIPNVSSTLASLNLSRNKFNGGIFFLCQMVNRTLEFLDLSHNVLSGQLPDCLWNFKELKVLNLGHNNLFGRLPASLGYVAQLEVLYLHGNEFFGELPLSLKYCTNLNFLDLGANKFSGNVPAWIGENLSGLYALILGSNNFAGTIPLQLCQLANLQILDLSMNHLHGTIPWCFNNLTSMVQDGSLAPPYLHPYSTIFGISDRGIITDQEYIDHVMIEWLGDEREFIRTNLELLKMIDLSRNNLTGQIPYELTNLCELLALNLSNNALLGEIPQQVGQMKKLLALDLSRNSFSGGIPSSMSQMTSLSYLDLSSNHLSGRIPSGTQLQSFDPSKYEKNTGLCGPPLSKKCPGDEEPEIPSVVGESGGDVEDIDEFWGWFYIGGGTGFATGFWIVCGTLLLNRRARHVFFLFYDSLKDWIYLKAVLCIVNLKTVDT